MVYWYLLYKNPHHYHKPEDEESKRLTFAQAATGASGIETLLSLSLELFHNGSVKLETIIQALTSNPAKILNINKGNLSIGNDADFCIVDINKPWFIENIKKNKLSENVQKNRDPAKGDSDSVSVSVWKTL